MIPDRRSWARRPSSPAVVATVRVALGLAAALGCGAGCKGPPPPAELPAGHLEWRGATGQLRLAWRATPTGYRVLDAARQPLALLERQAGALAVTVDGAAVLRVTVGPEGTIVEAPGGERRHLVREVAGERLVETGARFPVGRVLEVEGVVTAANAGGLPVGTVKPEGERLVLRARDGAVLGTLTGGGRPRDAALLLLEALPLEERAALLAVTLPAPGP